MGNIVRHTHVNVYDVSWMHVVGCIVDNVLWIHVVDACRGYHVVSLYLEFVHVCYLC